MKKFALSLAVLFSVAMVSCGGAKTETADTDTMALDTMEVVEAEATVDTDTTGAVDTIVAVAAEEVVAPAN